MHGKGLYTWKDGRRYEGEYHNDKKHVKIKEIYIIIMFINIDIFIRGMGYIDGLMEENMKGNGRMVNNMDLENIFCQMELKGLGIGRKGKDYVG